MMHYTGTIWRPPYEAFSLLLEVTAGCTHHRCKFCTLYADLPGANPFVLQYDRLMEIAELVHKYFPGMETIGCFARVTDVTLKSDEELAAVCNQLHPTIVGANMLTIYQDSRLYGEIRKGNWKEERETEKYREAAGVP